MAACRHPDKVLCVLWLGSSVGNLDDAEALSFFQDVLKISGARTQVQDCAFTLRCRLCNGSKRHSVHVHVSKLFLRFTAGCLSSCSTFW